MSEKFNKKMFFAAHSAMAKAYAPYSNFQVGAAILGSNGTNGILVDGVAVDPSCSVTVAIRLDELPEF